MLIQFAFGVGMIVLTQVVATVLMAIGFEFVARVRGRIGPDPSLGRTAIVLSLMALAVLVALSVVIWIWTFAVLWLGVFETLEDALYFTLVAFTTLGFGENPAAEDWRLLSGFVATGGFILFGLSTAFLFEAISELRHAHRERRKRG